jgi:PHD/YefM family antitoxin component YafN of YafNO toxin-antitoxin module
MHVIGGVFMETINATNARKTLFGLIDQVNE